MAPGTGARKRPTPRRHQVAPIATNGRARDYWARCNASKGDVMGIIWSIIIGFIAGMIAKWITPGDNKPSGFILTTVLGILGAVVATVLGQAVGWYGPNDGAGFIASIVGAIILLLIWRQVAGRR